LLLLLCYIRLHPGTCILFHQSLVRIILYHACSLLDIIYYLSTFFYMYVLMTRFSIHAPLIWIYRYTRACPCTPLGIHYTTCWGVSDSPGSSCPDPRAWSLWYLLVAYQRFVGVAWIIGRQSETQSFQAPCSALEFSFCDS